MISIVPAPDDDSRWDRFVENAESSSFCHLAGWRHVMSDVFGHECLYAVARDASGNWRGVLPLVRVKSPLLGHYLVSMPFLNAGGPLGDRDAQQELAAWATREASRSRADLLELRARAEVPGALRLSHRKITVHLELAADAESTWRRFPSKLRSQIRRPQREGLEARFGPEHRAAFYDVLARNMRVLGTPVLPATLFARIGELFPHVVEFGVVYRGAEPVAAGCGFFWRGEFEMTWASSLREHARSAPNMLLYWSFMQRMIERGATRFDFGRCTPGGGTHQFKRQWGGQDIPLPWAQWSHRNVSATPSPERPVFRAAAACWRHLPLALTNAVGPHIAARLP